MDVRRYGTTKIKIKITNRITSRMEDIILSIEYMKSIEELRRVNFTHYISGS